MRTRFCRGAPARTSKPKFRVEAANDLIAEVPAPRDALELQRFATQRLGKDVLDVEDVDLVLGDRSLLDGVTWRLGHGDRVGLVGVNGAGKTSVLRLLADELAPSAGRVRRGRTVAVAHLSQHVTDIDPTVRVLDSVERVKRVVSAGGKELTASALLERFGFTGDRLTARVGDLSGGERRRLQLLLLLLTEPNVLLLDEPTNDLDIETLTVLEDFLDQWPGTLVVISHDRYFLERVCDTVHGLVGDGSIRMLPRGVEEYLELRRRSRESTGPLSGRGAEPVAAGDGASPAEQREARKTLARLERQIEKLSARETTLHGELAEHATDHAKLAELDQQLRGVVEQREQLEEEWLETAETAH